MRYYIISEDYHVTTTDNEKIAHAAAQDGCVVVDSKESVLIQDDIAAGIVTIPIDEADEDDYDLDEETDHFDLEDTENE